MKLALSNMLLLVVVTIFSPLVTCDTLLSSDCRQFTRSLTCDLSFQNILLDTPATEAGMVSEADCQASCISWNAEDHSAKCTHFSWLETRPEEYYCVLLAQCDAVDLPCPSPLCVTGPAAPAITDACCPLVTANLCTDMTANIDTMVGVESGGECQEACRLESSCSHFSWETEICFLFSKCEETEVCSSCLSGPFAPPISQCGGDYTTDVPSTIITTENTSTTTIGTSTNPSVTTTNTSPTTTFTSTTTVASTTTSAATTPAEPKDTVAVVLGGIGYGLVESVEVITPTSVCSPLPNVPSTKYGASAAYIPSTKDIVMCGGYDQYNNLNECHSLSLTSQSWTSFPSLNQARYRLSLTYASDLNMLVAIAGNDATQVATKTVESFTIGDSDWVSRPEWSVPTNINGHCSFYKSPYLYIVGGRNSGYELPDVFRLDVTASNPSWQEMSPMFEGKAAFACGLDKDTFYVAGGGIDDSAFYYNVGEDKWERLPALIQTRDGPGLSVVGGVLTVFGGRYSGEVDIIEEFHGGAWKVSNKFFTDARDSMAYVAVPSDVAGC